MARLLLFEQVSGCRRQPGDRHGGSRGGEMDLLVTLIIGGVVGWLASILMRTNAQMGILANVIVGIIGSFLGVAVANSLKMAPRGQAGEWIVAVLGAALLIGLLQALGVFKRFAAAR
jgi:uncharacterized membrane protein YeaQ/YmgE (transglycosylase-associated protein family)